jgi:small membrane protein
VSPLDPTAQLVIKVLLLVGVAVAVFLLTRSTAGAAHQALRRVAMVVAAVAAATVIINPALVSGAARMVGVGRGTDLLLYGLVVAFACFLATYYGRMRALNRQITALTRELALQQARRTDA